MDEIARLEAVTNLTWTQFFNRGNKVHGWVQKDYRISVTCSEYGYLVWQNRKQFSVRLAEFEDTLPYVMDAVEGYEQRIAKQ